MHLRSVVQFVALLTLVACGGMEPPPSKGRSERAIAEAKNTGPCGDAFTPVFAIMTQPRGPDSNGCRGCHIGDDAIIQPGWGDTQDEVRMSLEDRGLVMGGRASDLAFFLHVGIMPQGGMAWDDDQLALLDAWLINYE